MAVREKKFILEFDAPKENGSCRVAIAQHPQKNKFPHLYSVYIWKWNGFREDWVKEYYYDREQKCFFRPYKMQYLESVGKTARYIRNILIDFFAQQAKAKEQEEKVLQEARDEEARKKALYVLKDQVAKKYEDYCGYVLCKFRVTLLDLEDATRGKTLVEAEKSIKALPEQNTIRLRNAKLLLQNRTACKLGN